MLRIGVAGYGTDGRHFHAPFIQAAEGCTLAGVVARADKAIAAVQADYPGLPVFASLDAMIASGAVDAVTITTPPETRRGLVLQAIAAGLHVVADKPGRYHAYYEAFARAVRTSGPAPVTATEGTRTLAVLDAARLSAAQGCSVAVAVDQEHING